MSFLAAEWRKLAIINYEIDSSILEKYVPYGTELDLYQGKCYVSLIGFMFLNTKLLGIKVPFHRNFEEVNLRFYVKRYENNEWRRGVVFIKEIVPKRALTFVANTVYKEHYQTMKMRHDWQENTKHRKVSYQWKTKKSWNSIALTTEKEAIEIKEGSKTEFITEHYWGYARINDSKSNAYEVKHPKWKIYPVLKSELNVDFEATYGKEFAFLNTQKPASSMLAEGSEISVEPKQKL